MGRTQTRIIGAVAALLAAGLAGFSLRSQQQHTVTTVAARNPAADVRTQVIRRTIHIVRHQHPRHAARDPRRRLDRRRRRRLGLGELGPHRGQRLTRAASPPRAQARLSPPAPARARRPPLARSSQPRR